MEDLTRTEKQLNEIYKAIEKSAETGEEQYVGHYMTLDGGVEVFIRVSQP